MIFINSGAYVIPEFQAELGRIPPCMLPLGNKKLIEHQVKSLRRAYIDEKIYVTLPESYHLTLNEKTLLEDLSIESIFTPDEFSLAEAILYSLNIVEYQEYDPIRLLYGDTLIMDIPQCETNDFIGLSHTKDNYNWQIEEISYQENIIWCGFYSFGHRKDYVQSLALSRGNFVKAVQRYRNLHPVQKKMMDSWHHLGHVNTYFRSRALITTQRAFNTLNVNKGVVYKTGEPEVKIMAEGHWFHNLPFYLKRFTPQLINYGKDSENKKYYELEYLPIMPLNELFVHGRNSVNEWQKIFHLTDEFLLLCRKENMSEAQTQYVAHDFSQLIESKTYERLAQYSTEQHFDLDHPIRYGDYQLPSVRLIAQQCIQKTYDLPALPAILHGDLCFSNMFFDSRADHLKVIDPRGLNMKGELSMHGDQRYDLAKISHSILGLYDFIIAGRYRLIHFSRYHFEIDFELDERICDIQHAFSIYQFSHQVKAQDILPLVILLFLSMLPLHDDRPDRQRAMLANAIRLYSKLI
jgi:hypothetical protein